MEGSDLSRVNLEGLGTDLQQVDLDSLVSITSRDSSPAINSIADEIVQSDPTKICFTQTSDRFRKLRPSLWWRMKAALETSTPIFLLGISIVVIVSLVLASIALHR